MNEATVQDELDFENLPQETKDLVKRLFAAEYFGEIMGERGDGCPRCDELEEEVDELKEEIEDLEKQIEELENE